MKIDHIALWTRDVDTLRAFYCRHFGCVASALYDNPAKGFRSYFLRFTDGARIEVMQKVGIDARSSVVVCGLAHFAISVGSEEEVRAFTEKLRSSGVVVVGEPRWTGDGCFESVVADPDGNLIEITI